MRWVVPADDDGHDEDRTTTLRNFMTPPACDAETSRCRRRRYRSGTDGGTPVGRRSGPQARQRTIVASDNVLSLILAPLFHRAETQAPWLHVTNILGRGRVPTLDQLAMDAQHLARRIEVHLPSFTLMPSCVVGTQRIGTLQTQLALRLTQQWPLRVLRCPVAVPQVVTAVQWRRHLSHDPAILWVRSTLRDVARTAAAGGVAGAY
jgi:DNA-binding transcriptional LysR family regulator